MSIGNNFNSTQNVAKKMLIKGADYKLRKQEAYSRMAGAFNFGLLCAVQAEYMHKNKDIPDNSKKFLVTSEIIEGLMKIGIFMGFASGFGFIGEKLVDNGFITSDKFIPKEDKAINKAINKVLSRDEVKANIKKITKHKSIYIEEFANFCKFKKGMNMVSNIAGMIVGLSVLVPIIRNTLAKKFKEKYLNTSKNTDNSVKTGLSEHSKDIVCLNSPKGFK